MPGSGIVKLGPASQFAQYDLLGSAHGAVCNGVRTVSSFPHKLRLVLQLCAVWLQD